MSVSNEEVFTALETAWRSCLTGEKPQYVVVSREFAREMRRKRHSGSRFVKLGDDTALELDILRFAVGGFAVGGFTFGSYVRYCNIRRVRRALRRFIDRNPHMTAPLQHLNLSGRRFR